MIQREAIGNDRRVEMKTGTLSSMYPAITINTANDEAEFTLTGGLAYVTITFTGLTSPRAHTLLVDGQPLNQRIHGNDFWKTDLIWKRSDGALRITCRRLTKRVATSI